MPELLLELFSEEIPARMQSRAAGDLQKLVQDELFTAGFRPDGAKAFVTPRRLSLIVTGLPGAQPDRKEEKKGPRVGAPEKAVAGFLKSAGLASIDECEIRSDKKGEFYVAVIDETGRPTSEVIAGFMPELVRKFPWPKAMRWGDGSLNWVRPLHSVLCTFDGEIVEFEVDGLKSSDKTYGHRFLAPDEIRARSFEDYELALSRAKVVLDKDARAEQILADAKSLCAAQGLELVEDQGLLSEVAGLAEWPVTLLGAFDAKFLKLPDEVLTASMKGHQKYFSVRDPKTGRLANKFVFASNIEAPDGGAAMRTGYERVLTARLSDAWFMYQQDLAVPLEAHAKKLDDITFYKGLGSIGDKVRRLEDTVNDLSTENGLECESAIEAATLCKADLVTGMVGEFPELQGRMGKYYAIAQAKNVNVADAIAAHYKPVGQNDELPVGAVGTTLAMADKFDSLIGFFALSEVPTGSKDPFALRRAALGIIRIVLDTEIRLSIQSKADGAIQLYRNQLGDGFGPGEVSKLIAFFHDRLKVYLRDKGHRHDHVDAVRIKPNGSLEDDLVLIVKKLEALEALLKTEDGTNLLAAYKRAANILKAEEKKSGDSHIGDVDENLLSESAERALYSAIGQTKAIFGPALDNEDFATAMAALAGLRDQLDTFFDDVTVNVEDKALRANRLSLLTSIIQTCEQVADLSRIEG